MRRTSYLTLIAGIGLALASPAMALTGTDGPAHGMAMHGEPKYGPAFSHFDYADPGALTGGEDIRRAIGTFDSLNPFIIQGNPAAGIGLIYDTLTTSSADEAFTQYCLLCATMEIPDDRSWVEYELRHDAFWHDGEPITPADVIFSFNALREKGAPFYRFYYRDVTKVEQTGPRKVKFSFGDIQNPELALIVGQLPILPAHYWETRDIGKTTLDIPLGSGPYKISDVKVGRSITLERVPEYWGRNQPTNIGRNNIDTLRYEYFRDPGVGRIALVSGDIDRARENSSKAWATEFTDTKPVQDGKLLLEEFPHQRTAPIQGFVFNLRKPMFQDRKVREALTNAFDFEWSNKNLFYGAYTRTDSFFDNSDLGSRGLLKDAGAEEREILERFRDQLPAELFTQAYTPPTTDGSGTRGLRGNLRTAAKLLDDAGWVIQDGKRVNAETGAPFQFEILLGSQTFERIALPFARNLERLGIEAKVRVVDASQYRERTDSFDFDMISGIWGQSESPGNEQLDFWSSIAADRNGSRNLIGISDPVIDELIELVITAPNRDSLIQRTRALDRALIWGNYVIPQWHNTTDRIVFWDRYGIPEVVPRGGVQLDTWWIDPDKDADIRAYRGRR
ncbi:MAG: extracellular solute-binding protein [Alphaproteobacteria bacterium]|jgi:microcin C transport system substrate-binding protein